MKIYQSAPNVLDVEATNDVASEGVVIKVNGEPIASGAAQAVAKIETPASASAEACATSINAIIDALKAAGIMK